jgi:hypothetical protein
MCEDDLDQLVMDIMGVYMQDHGRAGLRGLQRQPSSTDRRTSHRRDLTPASSSL